MENLWFSLKAPLKLSNSSQSTSRGITTNETRAISSIFSNFFLSSIFHVTVSKCIKNRQLARSCCLFYQIWKRKRTKEARAEGGNTKLDASLCQVMSLHFFVKFQLNMSVPFATVPCGPQCKRNADTDSVKCVWKSPLQGKLCFFEFEGVFSSLSMFFDTFVYGGPHLPCQSYFFPWQNNFYPWQNSFLSMTKLLLSMTKLFSSMTKI